MKNKLYSITWISWCSLKMFKSWCLFSLPLFCFVLLGFFPIKLHLLQDFIQKFLIAPALKYCKCKKCHHMCLLIFFFLQVAAADVPSLCFIEPNTMQSWIKNNDFLCHLKKFKTMIPLFPEAFKDFLIKEDCSFSFCY